MELFWTSIHISHVPVSILMTPIPGEELSKDLCLSLDCDVRASTMLDLKGCIGGMRVWNSPFSNPSQLSSVMGTAIRSMRVLFHLLGPCDDEDDCSQALMKLADGSEKTLK